MDTSDKLIMSQGLDVALSEPEAANELPRVCLRLMSNDETESELKFYATLSSLDTHSCSLMDFPLAAAVKIIAMRRTEEIAGFLLEIGEHSFQYSDQVSVYLSTTGTTCMLSLTEANE